MPKCRENRTRRARRRANNKRSFIESVAKRLLLRRGHRPYYEPYNVRIKGRNIIWRERTTAEYRKVMYQLIEMCKGVTVDLSEIMNKDNDNESSPGL